MTNLTINQQSPAITAYQSVMCKEMTQAELLPQIIKQYQIVLAYSGQSGLTDSNQLNIVARLIEQDLRQTKCTIEQFKIAVQEGMKSSEVFSANAPATYNKWVKAYLDKVRMELSDYRAKVLSETKPSLTESEKLKLMVEGVMHCFWEFKRTGKIIDAGGVNYRFLESLGFIELSIEEKTAMFESVKQEAINRIKMTQIESDRHTARSLGKLIEQAEQGNEVDEVRFEQQRICRNKILRQFFTENQLSYETVASRAGL